MPMFRKKKDEGGSDEPSILSRWSSEESTPEQGGGADTGERRESTWLEESQAADQPPQEAPDPSQWAPRPEAARQEEPSAPPPQAQEQPAAQAQSASPRVEVKEQKLPPGGPPDLANYDPEGDAYNQNKIPGAQAREEYARSLVPPGGDPSDEYRWHTGRIRPTGRPDAVEFVEVHKAFGRNKILRGLNMGIPEGQISMILGPSGTGKSVCIKHMVGLLYPDDGDVLVHGESVPNMPDERLFEVRKKFGVLFQDGALFGSMNLFDNVAFPLRQHTDKGEDEVEDIVMRRLREVGLEQAIDKFPNELSGGMRKRAGFARALVLDPDIVLFDEPDSGLDPVRTALLCELIQEVHEENGGAYVVITHDIMSAKRVAEHISVLWKGRIVESGPAEELFNSDNMFVRQFLSGASRGPLGME
jgi:phospholipid/cholesterol/gamma-HCH transport system ATP-binding protein